MATRNPKSLQNPLLPKLLCSLASLKWKRIRQLKVEIDSTAHSAKTVGVENEANMLNCIVVFRSLECPHCTNDLCPVFIETRLDITVSYPLIFSTVLFNNGLGDGTEFATCNVVINVVFWNERGCKLHRASAGDIKGSTENDAVCNKQCYLNCGLQRNCV